MIALSGYTPFYLVYGSYKPGDLIWQGTNM